jgi:hypothetical protein
MLVCVYNIGSSHIYDRRPKELLNVPAGSGRSVKM